MDNRVLLFYKNKLNSLSKEVNKYNNINKYTAVGKLASFLLLDFLYFGILTVYLIYYFLQYLFLYIYF